MKRELTTEHVRSYHFGCLGCLWSFETAADSAQHLGRSREEFQWELGSIHFWWHLHLLRLRLRWHLNVMALGLSQRGCFRSPRSPSASASLLRLRLRTIRIRRSSHSVANISGILFRSSTSRSSAPASAPCRRSARNSHWWEIESSLVQEWRHRSRRASERFSRRRSPSAHLRRHQW